MIARTRTESEQKINTYVDVVKGEILTLAHEVELSRHQGLPTSICAVRTGGSTGNNATPRSFARTIRPSHVPRSIPSL